MAGLRAASCLLLVFALGACPAGVTLTLRDGSTVSGHPIDNDDTSVEVQTGQGLVKVCKHDVTDADHAGNGLVNGGLGAVIGGLVLTALSSAGGNSGGFVDTSSGIYPGLGFLAGGIALAIVGFSQYNASKTATGLPAYGETLKKCKASVWYVDAGAAGGSRGSAGSLGTAATGAAGGMAGTAGAGVDAGGSADAGGGADAGASGAAGADSGPGDAGGQSDAGTAGDASAD